MLGTRKPQKANSEGISLGSERFNDVYKEGWPSRDAVCDLTDLLTEKLAAHFRNSDERSILLRKSGESVISHVVLNNEGMLLFHEQKQPVYDEDDNQIGQKIECTVASLNTDSVNTEPRVYKAIPHELEDGKMEFLIAKNPLYGGSVVANGLTKLQFFERENEGVNAVLSSGKWETELTPAEPYLLGDVNAAKTMGAGATRGYGVHMPVPVSSSASSRF